MSGSLVSPETRAKVKGLMTPIAVGLGRLGLTPNALTVIGFLISCVAAIAAGLQLWLAAGLLVIFGGVFDAFDGALARATGRVSRAGGFLDATFDRWGEGVVYIGIIWGAMDVGVTRPVILAALAMLSAFMVSYTRARAESFGFSPGKGMANIGFAPREIRLVIVTVGLVLTGLVPGNPQPASAGAQPYPLNMLVLEVALGLIAILATITTIQRIVATLRQAAASEG